MADPTPGKPVENDIRHDDLEFNPALEPRKSKAWLNMLQESEDAFQPWNDHCDRIDKQFANLERLSMMARDKEFQMFWANVEVIRPAILAKPPRPVVVTKFKDRRPVYQAAAEVMERCTTVAFDIARIEDLMLLVRDDLVMASRGVAWCRYESARGDSYYEHEKVCIDFKQRRDFLHSISRSWPEVTWVAAASYLTRAQARKRFRKHSGDAYQDAEYKVDKDSKEIGGADSRERAKFWEIWSKTERRVVWVAQGCEKILDEDEPHLDLECFFPCPKPAYGVVQRGSLVPVPDVLQYRDQLEELNLLTSRIHALSDALEVKGFYPSGGAELASAIETAIKTKTPGRMLIPIANWAAFGGTKEVIVWIPIEAIAQTITALVALRKQIIEDIYQIMGLSDIMRGASDARETLGAQQLKSQFGSSRIRDKQTEMVRMSKDLVGITAEIICQSYSPVTIIEMSQTQLPTQAMRDKQIQQLQMQLGNQQLAMQKLQQLPQAQQMAQQNPQQAQELMQKGQQLLQHGQDAIKKILAKPTIEQVLTLFENTRAKSFIFDIETDSTIMIDENAEKQRRGEYLAALSALLPQLAQMLAAEPKAAEFCGELLKFATAPFRAGRQFEGAIDELVENMKQKADQPKPDDPITAQNKAAMQIETMKNDRAKERDKAEMALKATELKQRDEHEKLKISSQERIKAAELRAKQQDDEARAQLTNSKAMQQREKHQADMFGKDQDIQVAQQKAEIARQAAEDRRMDMAARQSERLAAQQFKQSQQVTPYFGGH
jgi:hypothetical protein